VLTFSLILAALGRTAELETPFSSPASQAYPGFDCIVVDQNGDDRVEQIVDRWQSRLPLRRISNGYASDSVFPSAATAISHNLRPAHLLADNNQPFAAPNRRLS
jgi:cellulose synthase/poly-beta-1,6-N-acetylglucosamine synthase-like glycosyltransferase